MLMRVFSTIDTLLSRSIIIWGLLYIISRVLEGDKSVEIIMSRLPTEVFKVSIGRILHNLIDQRTERCKK